MSDPTRAPAGWYEDGSGGRRYWDGDAWTQYLAPALETIGLGLGSVDYVLNSHGHMDHLGGNAEMKDAGAEISIHGADAERSRSNQGHLDRARAGLTLLGLEDRAPAREAMLLRLLGREVGCDRELDDGEEVDLGSDVKLTDTKGLRPSSRRTGNLASRV